MAQAVLKAFRQKIEHIKHCGFPTAIGAEQDRQRCKILEFNSVQRTIVFYPQVFDADGFTTGTAALKYIGIPSH
jgi:hypothetical protein